MAGGKVCDRCKAPYKGYGTTCSGCRRLPGPEWMHCDVCGSYFNGYGPSCTDCSNKKGDPAAAEASPGAAGQSAVPRSAAPSSVGEEEPGDSVVKVPSCASCHGKCTDDDKGVPYDGKFFHERCFVCTTCAAPLRGAFIPGPQGERHCPKCAPGCEACRKPLVGYAKWADGKRFHPDCFRCAHCSKKLGTSFLKYQGKHLCETCGRRPEAGPKDYKEAKAKFDLKLPLLEDFIGEPIGKLKCAFCRQVVSGEMTEVKGLIYHPRCFKCHNCGDKLAGSYCVISCMNYCKACANSPDVAPIMTKKCSQCKGVIKGKHTITPDGAAMCLTCAPKVQCGGCGESVQGDLLKANGKSYHPDCFVCSMCRCRLANGFCHVEGGMACEPCAKGHQEKRRAEDAEKCTRCSGALCGEYVDVGNGEKFHSSCFTCDSCSCALTAFVAEPGAAKMRYLCEDCA